MSNTIRIKRRANGGGAGAPNTMANGELAFNEQTNILYYGKGTGGANGTATSADPIGGPGAFVALTGTQSSIAGDKTFTSLLTAANGLKVGVTPVYPASAGQAIFDSVSVNTGSMSFLNGATITVPTPTQGGHATTKTYVDTNFVGTTGTQEIAGAKTFTGTVIVPTPSQDTHAATKAYVDSIATSGVVWLTAAKAATVADIALSGIPSTIDGVSMQSGDRVLVKNQTNAAQNGVYDIASGSWTRSTDFDTVSSSEIASGKSIFVQNGNANGGTSWVLSTTGTITLGTTALNWTQIGGGQSETGKNVGDSGINMFVSKVGTELEIRKLVGNIDTGISIDAPGNLNGSARISISTVPLANGGLGTAANSADGFPLITGGTCTFATNVPVSRGGTNNNLSTAADYEIAVTDTSGGQKRIATTSFGSAVGIVKRTNPAAGVYGYEVDTATYLTTTSTIDGGTF